MGKDGHHGDALVQQRVEGEALPQVLGCDAPDLLLDRTQRDHSLERGVVAPQGGLRAPIEIP
jgi:hypothetical protein